MNFRLSLAVLALFLLTLGLRGPAMGQERAYHELSPQEQAAFDAKLKNFRDNVRVEPMIPVCVNGQGKITAAAFGDTLDCDPNETQQFLPLSSPKLNSFRSALLQERDMKLHIINPN